MCRIPCRPAYRPDPDLEEQSHPPQPTPAQAKEAPPKEVPVNPIDRSRQNFVYIVKNKILSTVDKNICLQ